MDDHSLADSPPAELSWQWLQLLAEQANASVWTVDRNLRITSSRGTGLRDLNLEQNELVGKTLYEYLETRDESFLPIAMHRRALRGETVNYVLNFGGMNLHTRLAPLRNEAGVIVGVAGVYADVTERVGSERLLTASKEVLEAIARGAASRDVLDLLTRIISAQAGGKPCSVMRLDPQSSTLHVASSAGLDAAVLRVLDGLPVRSQNGSCSAAVQTKFKVFTTNIDSDFRWEELREVAKCCGWQACWSTPLLTVDGSVLGTFAMYVSEPRGPTANEEQLLERACHLAQIALERDRSEAVRSEWESRLAAVLENSSDCVWAVDDQHSLLAFNRAYADFCEHRGISRPHRGLPLANLFNPEQDFAEHRFWQWIYSRALNGETFDLEHQLTLHGRTLFWLLSVAPILSGSINSGVTVVARDVTEQKQQELLLRWCAEELSLKTGREFFQEVVQHLVELTGMDYAVVGSLLPGTPQRIRTIAIAAPGRLVDNIDYDLAGSPCENTVNEKVCIIERGVQRAFPRDRMLAEMQVEGYVGIAILGAGTEQMGILALMSHHPLPHATPAIRALQVLAVRVAAELERQTTESALRMSEALYQSLVDNIPQHIFRKDLHGRFIFANRLFCEALGKPLDEIIGRTDLDFFPQSLARKYQADDSFVIRTGKTFETTEEHRTKQGDLGHVQVVKTPLRDSRGVAIGVQGIFWDVTARLRAEEIRRQFDARMQHTQKLESLGSLAGGISHDFNNLLGAIIAHTDLAKGELAVDSSAHSHLDHVNTAAQQAADLTSQMMAYAGKTNFHEQPLNLNRLVEEIASLLAVSVSKKVQLKYEFDSSLPSISGDATQVKQVVMNLIANAAEAIGDKMGRVLVRTYLQPVNQALLSQCFPPEGLTETTHVCLEVADTGAGMDEATRIRVFDPFYTTKSERCGLGLAAVLGIVRSHHGAISVQSQPGEGSVFRCLFPVGLDSTERSASPSVSTTTARGHGTILVVEDQKLVQTAARGMLEKSGYDVLTADDGADAIPVFEKHHDRISLVLLDMSMPRMGGRNVFPLLRRLQPDIRVLFTSGQLQDEALAGLEDDRRASFLPKPYRPSTLLAKIAELLAVP
jgi:PAS domain S-box-containing protein